MEILDKVLNVICLVVAGANLAMTIEFIADKDYCWPFWWNGFAFLFCLIMGIV